MVESNAYPESNPHNTENPHTHRHFIYANTENDVIRMTNLRHRNTQKNIVPIRHDRLSPTYGPTVVTNSTFPLPSPCQIKSLCQLFSPLLQEACKCPISTTDVTFTFRESHSLIVWLRLKGSAEADTLWFPWRPPIPWDA
ncbi:hypothetical protein AVEN_179074-1 [Araneus ventricosus]|uniref:Uncharacterized protein n=1 Tax=Araneus ventricosus TaxID=182803 RepID=A0A4Y2QD13_ARAVE|nr:hypothetical protein AVEN_179074-1 [Araneus ventricosus]